MSLSRKQSIDERYQICGKGLLVFVNNQFFGEKSVEEAKTEASYRFGSEKDSLRIYQALASFDIDMEEENFQTNLTAQEIRDFIETVKRKVSDGSYGFMIFLLSSHGDENYIIGRDEEEIMIYEEVIKPFHNNQLPGLAGKPKIFIINACRGSYSPRCNVKENEASFEVKTTEEPNAAADQIISMGQRRQSKMVSTVGDYCVVYSTAPDVVSPRDQEDGSFFLNELRNCIKKMARKEEVKEFKRIVEDVQKRCMQKHKLCVGFENYLPWDFYLPLKEIRKFKNIIIHLQSHIKHYPLEIIRKYVFECI